MRMGKHSAAECAIVWIDSGGGTSSTWLRLAIEHTKACYACIATFRIESKHRINSQGFPCQFVISSSFPPSLPFLTFRADRGTSFYSFHSPGESAGATITDAQCIAQLVDVPLLNSLDVLADLGSWQK